MLTYCVILYCWLIACMLAITAVRAIHRTHLRWMLEDNEPPIASKELYTVPQSPATPPARCHRCGAAGSTDPDALDMFGNPTGWHTVTVYGYPTCNYMLCDKCTGMLKGLVSDGTTRIARPIAGEGGVSL